MVLFEEVGKVLQGWEREREQVSQRVWKKLVDDLELAAAEVEVGV